MMREYLARFLNKSLRDYFAGGARTMPSEATYEWTMKIAVYLAEVVDRQFRVPERACFVCIRTDSNGILGACGVHAQRLHKEVKESREYKLGAEEAIFALEEEVTRLKTGKQG
jgi:hypothetical protein